MALADVCSFFFCGSLAIGNAYAVLSDTEKRKQYDLYGPVEEQQSNMRRRGGHHGRGHYDYTRGFECERRLVDVEQVDAAADGWGVSFCACSRRDGRGAVQHVLRRLVRRPERVRAPRPPVGAPGPRRPGPRRPRTRRPRRPRPVGRRRHRPAAAADAHPHPRVPVHHEQLPRLRSRLLVPKVAVSLWLCRKSTGPLHFVWQLTRKYPLEKLTSTLRVPYYVKDGFNENYDGNIRRLEASVEEEYVSTLRHNCYRERSQRESLLWRARQYGDKAMMDRANAFKTQSCEALEKLYSRS